MINVKMNIKFKFMEANVKYKEWLNEWLTYYVKPATKERTCKKYRKQVENHITPKLGEYELEDLSAQVLQKFTVGLIENGLAANTVNGIISVLKSYSRIYSRPIY